MFPVLPFRVERDFTIVARLRLTLADPPGPAPGPKVTTTDIKSSAYTDHKDLSCGAISGSSVTFGSASVTNSTFAAEVGGCANEGDKTATVTIPASVVSAHADTEAELEAEGFALGVVGMASSFTMATLSIEGDTNAPGNVESVFVSVIAPFLWAASAEESIDPARVGRDLDPGKQYEVRADTYTSAVTVGVVAETHAKATVSDLQASLTTVEQ
jgi:hypothetical protein